MFAGLSSSCVLLPSSLQLTNQGVFDSCKEKQLCVMSFLPHILDSGEEWLVMSVCSILAT